MWLLCPHIPDRYCPDRIGCVATLRPNNIVHISQASSGAAYRHDAYDFITGLTDAGFAVLIMWVDGADTEYRLRCNREFYPTPPTLKELVDLLEGAADQVHGLGDVWSVLVSYEHNMHGRESRRSAWPFVDRGTSQENLPPR